MKIEIPGYGPVELKDLRSDHKDQVELMWSLCGVFPQQVICGLINKIEELQMENRTLQGKVDQFEYSRGEK